ncbi:MAG: hypothetical protein M1837_006191 [Sclerophora amabilis]|nr:MAG: hypothetical protein M1837_006191 [Sclerophora amabilis]
MLHRRKKGTVARQPSAKGPTKSDKQTRRGIGSIVPLNHKLTERLDVCVFGANSCGEFGLGHSSSSAEVARPLLSPNLLGTTVRVVQIATGEMHCAALTHDNRILTWGANDLGASGRDTQWEGGLVDIKANEIEEKAGAKTEDEIKTKAELTPTAISADALPQGTISTQMATGDNATFALTEHGLGLNGILGFSLTTRIQWRPILIPGLNNVTKPSMGDNHVVTLSAKGDFICWGAGASRANSAASFAASCHAVSR